MPSYVKEVAVKIEYDGQTVSLALKPLLFEDALILHAEANEQSVIKYGRMLPNYVIREPVIVDVNGEAVPFADVCTTVFFSQLVAQIMAAHMKAATIADPH